MNFLLINFAEPCVIRGFKNELSAGERIAHSAIVSKNYILLKQNYRITKEIYFIVKLTQKQSIDNCKNSHLILLYNQNSTYLELKT